MKEAMMRYIHNLDGMDKKCQQNFEGKISWKVTISKNEEVGRTYKFYGCKDIKWIELAQDNVQQQVLIVSHIRILLPCSLKISWTLLNPIWEHYPTHISQYIHFLPTTGLLQALTVWLL